MNKQNRLLFPALFALSIGAMLMKKFLIPFNGPVLILVFDGIAILFFLRAFTSGKIESDGREEGVPRGRSFNFDIISIIYAICCIAMLYRLEYWNGWKYWVNTAGILFLLVSIVMIFSIFYFLKMELPKQKLIKILSGYITFIYFLALMPIFVFANPRTFHNLFNGTTYEEYVRSRFPVEEGTALLERYKPDDANSKQSSNFFFTSATQLEKEGKYGDALISYNKSIDIDPDNATAIYNRGRLKLTKLEIDKDMAQSAYDDFSRAIELDSTMAVAYYNRSVAWNYLYPKNRIPAHADLLKAQEFDTNLRNDKYVKNFLALPLADSTADTTTYVKQDD